MRSRVLLVAALALPVALLVAIAVARSGSSSSRSPARLPIAAGGTGARAALYPVVPTEYRGGDALPSLEGSARAYHVPAGTWTAGDPNATVSSGVAVACPAGADCTAPTTTRPPGLPSGEEARAIALDALRGGDALVDRAAVEVYDTGTAWLVQVDPVVDGSATEGFAGSVTVGPNGVIAYGSAPTGRPEPGDEYPLIGTSAAIERMNRGEGFVGPRPLAAEASQPSDPTVSREPRVVTFTSVEQVLLFAPSLAGQDGWLVPAYRFRADDGTTQTVLAIDDTFLEVPGNTDSTEPGSSEPGSNEPAPVPIPLPSPATVPESFPPVSGAPDPGR